jgi:hypothetical protein
MAGARPDRLREALQLYSAFYADPADWLPLAEGLGLGELLAQRFGKLSGGPKQRLFIVTPTSFPRSRPEPPATWSRTPHATRCATA